MASGLKINLSKSNLYGIGATNHEVNSMSNLMGCQPGKTPFICLGLPVGDCMSKIKAWDTLINWFQSKLSRWKVTTLSIGGRSMLLKTVLGSLGIYFLSIFVMTVGVAKQLESIRSHFFWGSNSDQKKMAWVSWDLVMASYSRGGLNIGSLVSFNLSLMLKWRWRFLHNDNMLWVRVIKHVYGQQGGFESSPSRITCSSPWSTLIVAAYRLINN